MSRSPRFFENFSAMSNAIDPAWVHNQVRKLEKSAELARKMGSKDGCEEAAKRIEQGVNAINAILSGPKNDNVAVPTPDHTESQQTGENLTNTSHRF